jgi:hypothetical protein
MTLLSVFLERQHSPAEIAAAIASALDVPLATVVALDDKAARQKATDPILFEVLDPGGPGDFALRLDVQGTHGMSTDSALARALAKRLGERVLGSIFECEGYLSKDPYAWVLATPDGELHLAYSDPDVDPIVLEKVLRPWPPPDPALFSMSLRLEGTLARVQPSRDYDPENDNIVSLLCDVCHSLHESGQVHFDVTGFGDLWPVDVFTELCIVMEQLPDAIRQLNAGAEGVLDFFEQGVERVVTMSQKGEQIELRCRSKHARWQPSPAVQMAPAPDVLNMLQELLRGFVDLVAARRPDVRSHPWFEEWLRGSRSQGNP